jgi:TRAP-type C4-dicarboxylate transport system permease small subunit
MTSSLSLNERILNGLGWAAKRAGDLAMLTLISLVLMIAIDIILRRFFDRPLSFSFEVIQIGMVVVVFGSISYSSTLDRHVGIDILVTKFSQRTRHVLSLASGLLSTCLFGLICWQSVMQGIQVMQRGTFTGILEIPLYPFYFIIAVCSGIVCLANCFSMLASKWEAEKVA